MKAVLCKAFGPPDSLVVEDVPPPRPRPGQVVIAVKAAGINFLDGLMIQGKYQLKPPFPFSPGAEVAGIVSAVGEGVTGFRPGSRVLSFCGFGGYAGEVAVDAARVIPIPDHLDFLSAGGLVVTYATAYHGLKDKAGLKPGETLLVLGAAGGTGLAAVEIAKAMGARVIAAASSADKLALALERGADLTINYAEEDLRERLKQLTEGRGVDVVYDPVGGSYAEPAVRSLAWEGRYLVVGFAAGDIPRIPLNLLLLKTSAVIGVLWGAWADANPSRNAGNLAELFGWCREGRLDPRPSATFPLDRFREGLDLVMNRKVKGKVVLIPPSESA